MAKIKTEDCPLGIRYWAQFNPKRPKMQVYRCIGISTTVQTLYMFESVGGPLLKHIIVKDWTQLNADGFKPFLLPIDKIRRDYGGII